MNFTGKSMLITGASGFIGSFIVERALAEGAEVWAAMRPTSSRRYLRDSRIHFIELDLNHADRLQQQLQAFLQQNGKEWDYVVHAAGATKCRHAADFFTTNTQGTENLAKALLTLRMKPLKFVFISSLSVYGPARETAVGREPGHCYAEIRETDTPCPDTAYGRSKLEAERRLAALTELPCVTLRPTGVYGPRERDYFLMAQSIAGGVDFAVGYRPQEITFIYVSDLVEAVMLALDHGQPGRAYFLSDGQVYSSRTFSDLLQKSCTKPTFCASRRRYGSSGAYAPCPERQQNCWGAPLHSTSTSFIFSNNATGSATSVRPAKNWASVRAFSCPKG